MQETEEQELSLNNSPEREALSELSCVDSNPRSGTFFHKELLVTIDCGRNIIGK